MHSRPWARHTLYLAAHVVRMHLVCDLRPREVQATLARARLRAAAAATDTGLLAAVAASEVGSSYSTGGSGEDNGPILQLSGWSQRPPKRPQPQPCV